MRVKDSHYRLEAIFGQAGCGSERTFYFRVVAHIGNRTFALCERGSNDNGDYYCLTQRGRDVLEEVAAYVKECLDSIVNNGIPWREEGVGLRIE